MKGFPLKTGMLVFSFFLVSAAQAGNSDKRSAEHIKSASKLGCMMCHQGEIAQQDNTAKKTPVKTKQSH